MIISNKQLNQLQGGIENHFIHRLAVFAKENLNDFIDQNEIELVKSINKILELSKKYNITTELNIVRLMIISFEKGLTIPFEPPIKAILLNSKCNEYKRIEELFFLTYSNLNGLKEISIQN